MTVKSKINIALIFIAGSLLSSSVFTAADGNPLEVENESSFSYDIGAVDGPQNWGSLNPNWTLCGTGSRQSPIDIIHVVPRSSSYADFKVQYESAPAVMRSSSHHIEIEWTRDAGGIVIRGNEYKLRQCHWHMPSEHTINGSRFDMEMHIVHRNYHGDTAVVGIMYKSGPVRDSFISKLSPYIRSVIDTKKSDLGVIDPRDIGLPRRSEYFRYIGSLTTPPCSENVTWTLFKTVKPVSSLQIKALRDAVDDGSKGNARPLQPLNSRHVYLFRVSSSLIAGI